MTTVFDTLTLNLAFLLAALPIVTLPIAISAAYVVLDRRCDHHEDRVLTAFATALRSRAFVRTTIVNGLPLLAVALALLELNYFAYSPELVDQVCFGFGVTALLATLSSIGYVFLLAARSPSPPVFRTWSLACRFGLATVLSTGLLFIVELVGASLLALLDPFLCLLGLPILLLQLMCRTSRVGVRRRSPTT